MIITAFFTKNGVPQTSLTPTINITSVSNNTDVITSGAMLSNHFGNYYYDFLTYAIGETYTIRCDGGATLPDPERYTYNVWTPEAVPIADFGS